MISVFPASVEPTAHALLAEVTATPANVALSGAKLVSFHALPVHRMRNDDLDVE